MKTKYLFLILILAFSASLTTGMTQIQPGERAVIRRLGRLLAEKPGPGLYLGLPWGLERVDRVAVDRVRRLSVGFLPGADEDGGLIPVGQVVTGDHNLIDIQIEVYYTVGPTDDDLVRFVLQEDRVDELIPRTAEAVLVEGVAGKTVDDLVSGNRTLLQQWLRQQLQERLRPYELGVTVQAVSITYLNPPREVKEAFAEVARAETQRETRLNEARQQAHRRLREAEAEAFRIRRLAQAYAQEQRLLAQAQADSFRQLQEQYQRLRQQNPDYLNVLWWEQINQLYRQLRQRGGIDLLDHHLGSEGLDITEMPLGMPKR
jgi:membrane protease subunit HflK